MTQDIQIKEREALVAFAMAFLPLRNLQEVLQRVRDGAWAKEDARKYGFLWRNQHEELLRQLELVRADRAAIVKVRESLEGKIPCPDVNRVHAT